MDEFAARRKARIVTPERARLAAHRLINSHFNNRDEHARMSIPVNLDDDDIVILDFIAQHTAPEESETLRVNGLQSVQGESDG